MNRNSSAFGRLMFIVYAAVEYLIALLVQGTFLARITGSIGISDGLTGIISSFISLGCLFELISIFIRPRNTKHFVIIMSIINQLLFTFLYVIPVINVSQSVKPIIFTLAILSAYIIYYIAHPRKTSWMMSFVDDASRGKFTAVKEIISLIAGIIFPIIMGAIVDMFTAKNNEIGAFLTCGITILFLTVLHTVTLMLTPKSKNDCAPEKNNFTAVFKDKKTLLISLLLILWNIAHYSATPFFGTFQVNELGFSLSKASVITAIGSIARIIASPYLGSYADKKGFPSMLNICFAFAAASFASVIFANRVTGTVCFILYYVFMGIAMGGINSAILNLVFDVVAPEISSDAFAVTHALAGTAGFIASVAASRLLSFIQSLDNIGFYAQQLLSVIAVVFTLICIIYLNRFIIQKDKSQNAK